jgi:hypothetical protein
MQRVAAHREALGDLLERLAVDEDGDEELAAPRGQLGLEAVEDAAERVLVEHAALEVDRVGAEDAVGVRGGIFAASALPPAAEHGEDVALGDQRREGLERRAARWIPGPEDAVIVLEEPDQGILREVEHVLAAPTAVALEDPCDATLHGRQQLDHQALGGGAVAAEHLGDVARWVDLVGVALRGGLPQP